LRGELAYNDGATSEASLQVEQRVALARKLWEGEAAQRLAAARKEWDAERAQLTLKVQDLEGKLRQATDDLQRVHDERADWQGNVRTRLRLETFPGEGPGALAAPAAIPPKPKSAAIKAMTKNNRA